MAGFAKARLEPEPDSKIKKIECMFNPTTLTISKGSTWKPAEAWKNDAPNMVFDSGQSGQLDVTLTLDTTDTGEPVTQFTNAILMLMKVFTKPGLPGNGKEAKSKVIRPPWVRFSWGRSYSFKSVVTSAKITFTYFSSDGKPLRATVVLKLQQFEDEDEGKDRKKWPLQNPTSYTPELHTLHTIKAGETLDQIAFQHYGDSTLWKAIARSNMILDPLELTVGTHLQIPDQEAVTNAR